MAKLPSTPALRMLREADVPFAPQVFKYKDKGGTAHSAAVLGIAEHQVIKTLIFENEKRAPLCVLMHGDLQVSAKKLAREADTKSLQPCSPKDAERHSGYRVGGTSPFGLRTQMPLFMEASIGELDSLVINGGSRGVLVRLDPQDLIRVLAPTLCAVAQR